MFRLAGELLFVIPHIPVISRYFTHPWVSPYGPALRITSCNSPYRLALGHSNLLPANLVSCSNLIRSNLPGLLRSTNSFLMNLSLHAQRKVTKRKGTPTSLPYRSPHHSTLPTGHLDSPSGLDKAKFDVHVEFSLPKPNGSANFTGRCLLPSSSPKTALLVGAIDQGRSIESCRAGMRVKTTRWQ